MENEATFPPNGSVISLRVVFAVAMDALAASPFAVLDARGSLRLITDAVHEDDVLCLALACRALRDALWARFPARPAGRARTRASGCGRGTQRWPGSGPR